MNWETLLYMDGHGFYVWTSYGLGILIFAILYFSTSIENTRIIRTLKRRFRLELRQQQSTEEGKQNSL